MKEQPINCVQEAIDFLRAAGREVLIWGGGWIVYETGPEDAEAYWTAETDAALIGAARLEQSISLCLARDNCVPGTGGP